MKFFNWFSGIRNYEKLLNDFAKDCGVLRSNKKPNFNVFVHLMSEKLRNCNIAIGIVFLGLGFCVGRKL